MTNIDYKRPLRDLELDGDFQREVSDFVNRELGSNVSEIVAEMAKHDPDEACEWYYVPNDSASDEPLEVYEHWIIASGFMTSDLESKGELVIRDFYGLTIWGRTMTGQAISTDYVIQRIYIDIKNKHVA